MIFKKKTKKVRLIKTAELTNTGWDTRYHTEIDGYFIPNSMSFDYDIANSFFEKVLENKGIAKRKEVIRWANIPIIILMVIVSFTAHSQPILQLGAGFTSQNKMAAELSAGYNTRPVFFQVGYIASVTRDVNAGTYLNARIGHRFEHGEYVFEPSAGYAHVLKSTDRKYLNQKGMIYSFYAGKVINSGTLLLGVNYSEKVILGLLTIRYNL